MAHAETEWLAADPELPQAIDSEWDDALPAESAPAALADAPPADETEALCPGCGELLAWHDEFSNCRPAAAPLGLAPSALAAPADEFSQEAPVADGPAAPGARSCLFGRPAPKAAFAYELGRLVQPAPASPAQVIWRGQLKERHPATGLIHRVNVYRLDDGYWDCYREEELQAA